MGCSPWGHWELDTTEQFHFHFSLSCIGEGNSNPLQCYCLENPRDGGAWWAVAYGVAQSRTQLKRLSSSSSKVNQKRQKWSWLKISKQQNWCLKPGPSLGHDKQVSEWVSKWVSVCVCVCVKDPELISFSVKPQILFSDTSLCSYSGQSLRFTVTKLPGR